jgi:hypothetical protein
MREAEAMRKIAARMEKDSAPNRPDHLNLSIKDKIVSWFHRTVWDPLDAARLPYVCMDGLVIKNLKNPSNRVQIAAVQQNAQAVRSLSHPCEKALEIAILVDPTIVADFAPLPTRLQLLSVKLNPAIIRLLLEPCDEVYEYLLKTYPDYPLPIDNLSYKLQKLAVAVCPSNIRNIVTPSEELQLIAIRHNLLALVYITNPTPKVERVYNRLKKKQQAILDKNRVVTKRNSKPPTPKEVAALSAEIKQTCEKITGPNAEIEVSLQNGMDLSEENKNLLLDAVKNLNDHLQTDEEVLASCKHLLEEPIVVEPTDSMPLTYQPDPNYKPDPETLGSKYQAKARKTKKSKEV